MKSSGLGMFFVHPRNSVHGLRNIGQRESRLYRSFDRCIADAEAFRYPRRLRHHTDSRERREPIVGTPWTRSTWPRPSASSIA